jgi:hypothetical protein
MAAPYDGAPPEAPAPAPAAAAVSPQFCAPHAVPLTVVKKAISLSGGDFVVTDANGAEMLRVKGAVFSIHDRRVLRNAAGQPLVSMREKVMTSTRIGRRLATVDGFLSLICGLVYQLVFISIGSIVDFVIF